jgi:hypothetical protein
MILEVIDKTRRLIYLTKERWEHIIYYHPGLSDQIEEIKKILKFPLVITESDDDPNVRYYYRYYKNLKSAPKYILVAVKYLNGNGFIITSYYTNKIKGQK